MKNSKELIAKINLTPVLTFLQVSYICMVMMTCNREQIAM